jgi:hypothetical protein
MKVPDGEIGCNVHTMDDCTENPSGTGRHEFRERPSGGRKPGDQCVHCGRRMQKKPGDIGAEIRRRMPPVP